MPGAQGAVTGMQGIGVSTPSAAAVAASIIGLSIDMHMTKDGILSKLIASPIVPPGVSPTM